MTNGGIKEDLSERQQKLKTLEEDLEGLFPLPEGAATEYGETVSQLVLHVDQALMNHPRISELLGGCPINVMRRNHKNHARFMHTAFVLESPQMLANALPWVYRTYSTRGFSYDYFPAALSVWEEAVQEHLAPDAAQPIVDIYRSIQSHHEDLIELSRLFPVKLFRPHTWSRDLETLLSYLFEGSWQKAAEILSSSLEQGPEPERNYQERVQAVMYRTGALWEEGKISVAQEHLATSTMDRVMAYSYEKRLGAEPTKGRALVACPEDELHELGGRMVADMLEADGWDCTFLGANVPRAELTHMATHISPHIICLSATIPYHLNNLRNTIGTMRQQEALEDVRIMVGGLAFEIAPATTEQLGADGYAKDGTAAVELASKWWEEVGE